MKRYIILVFLAGLLFGVKPVPRNNGDDKDKKTKTEKVIKTSNKTEKKEKDRFIDNNSNGINDQREKDLQKIKQLNSKHKELLKKNNSKKSKEVAPPKKKASSKSKNR